MDLIKEEQKKDDAVNIGEIKLQDKSASAIGQSTA